VAFAKHFIRALTQIHSFTKVDGGKRRHDKVVVYRKNKMHKESYFFS
jgi:hypothetical protein